MSIYGEGRQREAQARPVQRGLRPAAQRRDRQWQPRGGDALPRERVATPSKTPDLGSSYARARHGEERMCLMPLFPDPGWPDRYTRCGAPAERARERAHPGCLEAFEAFRDLPVGRPLLLEELERACRCV